MSRRIIIEDDCPDHGEGCGRRLILTEPSPEMVERAAEASFNAVYPDGVWKKSGAAKQRESFRQSARAALTAALFGLEE